MYEKKSKNRAYKETFVADAQVQGDVAETLPVVEEPIEVMNNPSASSPNSKRSDIDGTYLRISNIKRRIILTIVTFGFYGIYWAYTIARRIELLKAKDINCAGEVVAIAIVPIYSCYYAATRSRFLSAYAAKHAIKVPDYSLISAVLALLRIDVVAFALLSRQLNIIAKELDSLVIEKNTESY